MRNQDLTVKEIEGKLQYYCSYQDRCHKEVKAKLKSFKIVDLAKAMNPKNKIKILHLIVWSKP